MFLLSTLSEDNFNKNRDEIRSVRLNFALPLPSPISLQSRVAFNSS